MLLISRRLFASPLCRAGWSVNAPSHLSCFPSRPYHHGISRICKVEPERRATSACVCVYVCVRV
ncbi:hypothetical protein PGIGA_G00087450 [Pangasianodon gigas]|uniref:Uncharacterized protein n=1 Tax=Pangasianodon gigas TaxID=30993 RepID=A0ACC5XCK3_PANGG|nr:hypothetical protein [Pangasianodon gigas]